MKQTTLEDIQPSLIDRIKAIAQEASNLPLEEKVNFLNEARRLKSDLRGIETILINYSTS